MSHLSNGSFTCYGDKDGIFFPMMCADGFLPRIVEDEPPQVVADVFDISLQYFSCCPPHHPLLLPDNVFEDDTDTDTDNIAVTGTVSRHCSDPITAPMDFRADNPESINEICADHGDQKYPFQMKSDVEIVFTTFGNMALTKEDVFLCCDSTQTQTQKQTPSDHENENVDDDDDDDAEDKSDVVLVTDFLDEIQCVPYSNESYQAATALNIVGIIDVVGCDVPSFPIPRPIGSDETIGSTGKYQCCKDGTGTALPPFVHDSAYKNTVYPIVAILFVAAIVSMLVVAALLIPFLAYVRQRWTKSSSNALSSSRMSVLRSHTGKSSKTIGFRSSNLMSSGQRRALATQRTSQFGTRAVDEDNRYSTYNLYLIYLVLADIVYLVLEIAMFGSTMCQKYYPNYFVGLVVPPSVDHSPLDNKISYAYIAANIWINAIVCHQVLILLQTSQRGRRISQPSIKRVHIQIGTVYLATALYGVALYFLFDTALEAGSNRDLEREKAIATVTHVLMTLMMLPPFAYVVYVAFLIWWKGYLPSLNGATARAKALRQLAFYFFRIVAVFVVVWLPVFLLLALALQLQKYWLLVLGYCLTASQPILTFCVMLTKADIRKYIWDFISLSYLLGDCNRPSNRNSDKSPRDEEKTKANTGATSTTVSGTTTATSAVNTSGIDGDDENDGEGDDGGDGCDDDSDENALCISVLGFSDAFRKDVESDTNGTTPNELKV
jgi:hypothetical protein